MFRYKISALIMAAFLFSGTAYANTISVQAFSADSGVAHLENFRSVVVNWANGNVEGSGSNGSSLNVKSRSLGELDMADEINPRVRASELLGMTVDTTSSVGAFVYTGLTATTSATLTTSILSGTAYVNGYRVSKSSTSVTVPASMDTYFDLSQTGNYTQSSVTVGATAPTVAANSARICKMTSSGTAITSVTDLANRRLPGLVVPSNFRNGMVVSKDSATTITVFPGSCEINNTILSKTAVTTLTLTTAGDWAGGSSLRAADTFGFVGMDASGNLKLHTTAPTNDNYAVSTTLGKKRYATWSSTVYRILGWFYMDGSQNIENASNIKEADVSNEIISNDSTVLALADSSTYKDSSVAHFYSSGGNTFTTGIVSPDAVGGVTRFSLQELMDGNLIPNSGYNNGSNATGYESAFTKVFLQTNVPQSTHTYKVQIYGTGTTSNIVNRKYIVKED